MEKCSTSRKDNMIDSLHADSSRESSLEKQAVSNFARPIYKIEKVKFCF